MNLNLGCGRARIPGFVGIDMVRSDSVDVQASATCLPFQDESFDFILASHIVEHIPDSILVHSPGGFKQVLGLDQFKSEIYRVLKPGGRILIRTPYRESAKYYLYHFKQFDERSFLPWTSTAEELGSKSLQDGTVSFEVDRISVSAIAFPLAWYVQVHAPRLYEFVGRVLGREEPPADGQLRLNPVFIGSKRTKEMTVIFRKPNGSGGDSITDRPRRFDRLD